ncbi:uncharacterized protein [Rutidosis leptorrhynchoides]|uniref:uncharacterized protein isoform X2 n=1 Tax=Rutidosis leptorrhynchoides TaxID=125765 RepID=UPI003A99EFA0
MGRRLLGFHPPHFSEDAAWLPAWLQPSTNQDYSPSPQALEIGQELGCLQPCSNSRENKNLSDDEMCKSFRLFLSGDDNSPMSIPSCSSNHEVRYHLHLSSNEDSQCSMNPISSRSQSERSKFSQTCYVQPPDANIQPLDSNVQPPDANVQPPDANVQHPDANVQPPDANVQPPDSNVQPPDANVQSQHDNLQKSLHESPSFKEQKVKKPARSQKVDIDDAIELAVAASEALEIHEAVKSEPNVELSIGLAVLEVALRVKQARLEDCLECLGTTVEETNEDDVDFDFLSDLDELTMADAYEDVGLTVTGHGDLSLSCNESVSHVKDSYGSQNYVSNSKQMDVDSGNTSSKEQRQQVNSANVIRKEHVHNEALITKNADLACGVDPVSNCSVDQAVLGVKEVALEREGFGVGDLTSSRTILRSSQQSRKSRYRIEREDTSKNLVPERFQSRWFGGWTGKNELSVPAVEDDKFKRNVPEVFANETSVISESADIAPDMNSCIQRRDDTHNIISQSSVGPEYLHQKPSNTPMSHVVAPEPTYDKASNREILLSDDLAVVTQRTNDKASYTENLVSDDVAVSPSMSPVDPLCSVVPCSFTSNTAASQNSENQVNIEKHLGPTDETNLENPKTVSFQTEGRSILKFNDDSSTTIRRRVVPLKTYSMLYRRYDKHNEKEHIHSDIRDDNDGHDQTANIDTEITGQMNKELNIPKITDRVELQSATVSRKVDFSCKSYLVPGRKRVHFSEAVINYPQVKKFKKMPVTRLKDPLVSSKICRRIKSSYLQLKSRPHDNKKMLFQDLKFVLTGFSVKKHKQIKNLIEKNGGTVYDDIPLSTSRRKRCSKLPLILCPKRLLTTKFLYACAVNACILKVKWLFDSLKEDSVLPPKKYLVLKEHASENCMVIGKSISQTYFIFDDIAIMLHGKPDFCSKMAKVIKHGGGLVFKAFHWLVKSIESKKVSVGIIVVEDENGVSRQLKQCALEQEVCMMPFSWIVNSLYAGRLVPLPELKIIDRPIHLELSEEI